MKEFDQWMNETQQGRPVGSRSANAKLLLAGYELQIETDHGFTTIIINPQRMADILDLFA